MSEEFKPITQPVENTLNLNHQVGKLFGEAFPSLAQMAKFKLDGLKDAAIGKVEDALGMGFKVRDDSEDDKRLYLDWRDVETIAMNEGNVKSYLGTPIFQPIWFKGGEYPIIYNGEQVFRSFKTLRLPATTVASFKRRKIVPKSTPSGGDGSTKEMFGFDDWDVTIQGLIMTEGNHGGMNAGIFPEDETEELAMWERIADSIEVFGGMFELLNVGRIVIDSAVFSKIAGRPNVIPFQFQCQSDTISEIIINAK